ncbi:hypothetical protein WKV44_03740 [Spirochaetia bacterium 38H-sp]|uniref:NADH dehydrogenase subunit 4L n=1 Tax=Rarispira pelagica TaxID=3141764 RepID=A0ABU9UCE3_9SPIR
MIDTFCSLLLGYWFMIFSISFCVIGIQKSSFMYSAIVYELIGM